MLKKIKPTNISYLPPLQKKKKKERSASFHPPENLAFSGVVLVFMGVLVEIQVENKKENQLL